MTVSTSTRTAGPFNGNGVTTAFPFTFKVFSSADLRIVKTSTLGIESDLVIGGNPSVTLNPNQDVSPGGTVNYTTLAVDEKLTIIGNTADTQPLDITNGSGFYASVIETAFDRCVMIIQQVKTAFGRAITFPVSDSPSLVKELPTATLRANKALVFQPDGSVGLSTADYEDQASDAAASAAAAAVSAAQSAASAAASQASADDSQDSADASAISAAASDASALASSGSASASAGSAAAALASENATAALLDNFDDRYLGAKASDPALDNDGNPLLTGALYWNTTITWMKVYTGAVWVLVTNTTVRSGSGAPAPALGSDGDFYIDTSIYNIYGPKAAGAWGSPTSLVGPPGPGTGDVVGPATSIDSELAIYNGTTGKLIKRSTLTATLVKITSGVLSAASAVTDYVAPGAITTRPFTMATARLLGRTTAATGAIEEITVGSGLSFAGGVLDVVPPGSVLLATLTPSGSSNVLESLNVFSSTYDDYAIIVDGVKPSANDNLKMRVAVAGVVNTGNNYRNGQFSTLSAATNTFNILNNVAAAGIGGSLDAKMLNVNSSATAKVLAALGAYENITDMAGQALTGIYAAASALTGVRFYWETGTTNFAATGSIKIYGIKK